MTNQWQSDSPAHEQATHRAKGSLDTYCFGGGEGNGLISNKPASWLVDTPGQGVLAIRHLKGAEVLGGHRIVVILEELSGAGGREQVWENDNNS